MKTVYLIMNDDGECRHVFAVVETEEVAKELLVKMRECPREYGYEDDVVVEKRMLVENKEEWNPQPLYVVEFNSQKEEVRRYVCYLYPEIDYGYPSADTFVRHWDLSGVGKSTVSYEDAIHSFELELKRTKEIFGK